MSLKHNSWLNLVVTGTSNNNQPFYLKEMERNLEDQNPTAS